MERDKCSLLLCVGILVGSFWKMSYALICWLSIWAYGNNGYGEEVRWSCSDKNRHGISFYKMSIFHHLVTFHISQVWKSLFGKNGPTLCQLTIILFQEISLNLLSFLTDLFFFIFQRLKLWNLTTGIAIMLVEECQNEKNTNDQINICSLSKFGCMWILESSIMQRCTYLRGVGGGGLSRIWHIS
jgi:hypothetical protein